MERAAAKSEYAVSARLADVFLIDRGRTLAATVAAFSIGLCLRYGWVLGRQAASGLGEADRVAIALARGRGFADAYRIGQGPTAHVLPLSPSIAALIYSLTGVHTPASRFLIATWSIGLCLTSYILLNRSFARMGLSQAARAGALIYLCLVPVYLGQEAQVLGVWDGGLTVVITALVLAQLTDMRSFRTTSAPPRLAATDSLLFFTNPLFGVAAFMATVAAAWRKWTFRMAVAFGALALVCVACLIGPWMIRNAHVLRSPVVTRSNAGLELALATNPRMLTSTPHDIAFTERLKQIHPSVSEQAYEEVRRVGEVAYSERMGEQAWAWIRAHPRDEARLIILHLRNTFAPEPWMFRVWSTPTAAAMRSVLASVAGLLGLVGLLLGLARSPRAWTPLALLVLVPALLLAPFQPISRYIYSFYAMLAFSAASLLDVFSRRIFLGVERPRETPQ